MMIQGNEARTEQRETSAVQTRVMGQPVSVTGFRISLNTTSCIKLEVMLLLKNFRDVVIHICCLALGFL